MRQDTAIVTCHFNPCGYKQPRRNYKQFSEQLIARRFPLYTVELTFGDQQPSIPPSGNTIHLKTNTILWHKEALLNHMVARLPDRFTKVILCDNDILFDNRNWLSEASEKLETAKVIQPYSICSWNNSFNQVTHQTKSALYGFKVLFDEKLDRWNKVFWENFHCGFAWGFQRDFFNKIGLFDRAIVGGGDVVTFYGVYGYYGGFDHHEHWKSTYQQSIVDYIEKCSAYIDRKTGWVDGNIHHLYHGSFVDRKYHDRTQLLIDYEPTDVEYDENRLLRWCTDKPELHRVIKEYFYGREEDKTSEIRREEVQ